MGIRDGTNKSEDIPMAMGHYGRSGQKHKQISFCNGCFGELRRESDTNERDRKTYHELSKRNYFA